MPAAHTRPTPAPLLKPGETVVLFDGVCKLCGGWARFLIRHDRDRRVPWCASTGSPAFLHQQPNQLPRRHLRHHDQHDHKHPRKPENEV
jgi:predicted DCC family thiol-disulfide oxidoreductase YuxK